MQHNTPTSIIAAMLCKVCISATLAETLSPSLYMHQGQKEWQYPVAVMRTNGGTSFKAIASQLPAFTPDRCIPCYSYFRLPLFI
mmetsp:Transcript_6326/g.16857  ORF Transcript_6326/g.16857 Transcript_6326/m.16857 type:complete len:84 (-) Transcript_6326:1592-1843(-)|eukprot:581331-Pelagomonas_calceolata.AAC.11